MQDLKPLWAFCENHFRLRSQTLGSVHWRQVEKIGLEIAKASGATLSSSGSLRPCMTHAGRMNFPTLSMACGRRHWRKNFVAGYST